MSPSRYNLAVASARRDEEGERSQESELKKPAALKCDRLSESYSDS
jgi:hypothetical protein